MDCSFEVCDRPAISKGLCQAHYYQRHRGHELTRINRKKNRTTAEVLFRDHLGRKQCLRCHAWLPESFFFLSTITADNLRPYCDRCQIIQRQESMYSMTEQDLSRLLEEQDFGCAICGVVIPGGMGTWHIDHDHNCCPGERTCGKCTRGLLCYQCNVHLGFVEKYLDRIIEYVHR